MSDRENKCPCGKTVAYPLSSTVCSNYPHCIDNPAPTPHTNSDVEDWEEEFEKLDYVYVDNEQEESLIFLNTSPDELKNFIRTQRALGHREGVESERERIAKHVRDTTFTYGGAVDIRSAKFGEDMMRTSVLQALNEGDKTLSPQTDAPPYTTGVTTFTPERALTNDFEEDDTQESNYLDVSCPKCGHIPRGERHLCERDDKTPTP